MDHTFGTRVPDNKVNIDTKISAAFGSTNKLKANQLLRGSTIVPGNGA